MVPLELALRFNSSIITGPEMVAIVNRGIDKEEASVMLLDLEFRICSISEELSSYFSVGKCLEEYSQEFKAVRAAFQKVVEDKKELLHTSDNFDSLIFQSAARMEAWKIYHWW